MLPFLLNPWMLLGLLGISLPVLAHLLSRRRFHVVEWGAMQFLNPSRKTRRRLKLEELLLLLLRIGMIVFLVLAVTRPMIPGGWLSGYTSAGSRTVVLIIDGSNSMSRSDGINSVHQTALRRAASYLNSLGPEDSAALIDARDQPATVIESPLHDLEAVGKRLRELPPPSGSCGMPAAISKAIGILGRTSAGSREIVVFTDRQAQGWKSTSEAEWTRIEEMLKFPAVRPRIWMMDVAPHLGPVSRNIATGRIEVSREMTVPNFPVRVRVPVRNDSETAMQVPVRLLLDGQPLSGAGQSPMIPAGAESVVEFEQTFHTPGTHVLTVEADISDDAIRVDNVSHVAVHVTESLPVLLVYGTIGARAADRDTFFAEFAFAAPEGRSPWVAARTILDSDLRPDDLNDVAAVILCNVAHLSPASAAAISDFSADGGGVIVACGPNTTRESFQHHFRNHGLFRDLEIIRKRDAPPAAEQRIQVAPLSIQPGWLDRFRSDPARSFLKAEFQAWCLTRVVPSEPISEPDSSAKSAMQSESSSPVVLASLTSGDPLICQLRHGEGTVLLLTSTLDRTWNDLPIRSDYVPFLHEAVFHVASARSHRNVGFAEPLVVRLPTARGPSGILPADDSSPELTEPADDFRKSDEARSSAAAASTTDRVSRPSGRDRAVTESVTFTTPAGQSVQIAANDDHRAPVAVYRDTHRPGVYRVSATTAQGETFHDAFVVNYDPAENDLTPLTGDDIARLITNDRVRVASSLDDLTRRMYGEESLTELWILLMLCFLLLLTFELWLTRRTVRRGYGGDSLAAAP